MGLSTPFTIDTTQIMSGQKHSQQAYTAPTNRLRDVACFPGTEEECHSYLYNLRSVSVDGGLKSAEGQSCHAKVTDLAQIPVHSHPFRTL